MASSYWYKDVLPFSAMVAVECTNVGINTLYKVATLKGLSYYVFAFYSFAIATLVLLPLVFTFRLMEVLALRSSITQAKIMGTLVSILGALIVVFYKGPTIISVASEAPALPHYFPLGSSQSQTKWVIGGLLLAVEFLLASIWFIVQGTGFSLGVVVHTWGLHLKGPVYVSIFKPLSVAIAAAMSFIFLGDALYLWSIIGAIILSIGFYAVIWAKAKEDLREDSFCGSPGSSSDRKSPLLDSSLGSSNNGTAA